VYEITPQRAEIIARSAKGILWAPSIVAASAGFERFGAWSRDRTGFLLLQLWDCRRAIELWRPARIRRSERGRGSAFLLRAAARQPSPAMLFNGIFSLHQ
jgi:hypothetical protein